MFSLTEDKRQKGNIGSKALDSISTHVYSRLTCCHNIRCESFTHPAMDKLDVSKTNVACQEASAQENLI